jgi:hypothetical protein
MATPIPCEKISFFVTAVTVAREAAALADFGSRFRNRRR